MVTRLIAGACVVALAALSESRAPDVARPVVVRASLPLAIGLHGERGHASFETTLGRSHWRFMAVWTGGREHPRLAVVLASEPVEEAE